jgi:competence protein ComEA
VPLDKLLGGDARSAWLASKPEPQPAASSGAPSGASSTPNGAPSAAPVTDTTVAVTPDAPPDTPAPAAANGVTSDGKVILNQASVEELMKLPGVGHKRATAIVALRVKLGGHFKRPTDLLRVKGIGVRGLKKMLPHLVLDAPAESTVHAELKRSGKRETAAG